MYPCLILCGGLATRLKPLTTSVPKSLIPVAGEPFLAHQLRLVAARGVERVVLCVGHLGEQIEAWAGNGARFGLKLTYACDGPVLLGTGGAIRQAAAGLEEPFFVLYGDSYLPCDWAAVADAFRRQRLPGLMTIYRNQGLYDTSNVEAHDGRIVRYDKRARTPAMQHIDYGLGLFEPQVFAGLTAGRAVDLAEVYQHLLAGDRLASCEVRERFYEIGSVAGIAELEAYLGGMKR
jgi:NDP-sugar pyrophosphorylase family protein